MKPITPLDRDAIVRLLAQFDNLSNQANGSIFQPHPLTAACRQLLAALDEKEWLLEWANEFIVEPEWFPNEGDRQLWRETRDGLPTK